MFVTVSSNIYSYIHNQIIIQDYSIQTHHQHADLNRAQLLSEYCESALDAASNESDKKHMKFRCTTASMQDANQFILPCKSQK